MPPSPRQGTAIWEAVINKPTFSSGGNTNETNTDVLYLHCVIFHFLTSILRLHGSQNAGSLQLFRHPSNPRGELEIILTESDNITPIMQSFHSRVVYL